MTNIAMSTLVLNSSSAKKILTSLFIDFHFILNYFVHLLECVFRY